VVKTLRFGWIACFTLLPLQAAEIVVAGRAIDENEAGIAGVEVTVRNQAGEQRHVVTDPTGGFKLSLPAEGSYFFDAAQAGYLPVKNLTVDVRAGMGEVDLILNHAKEVLQSVDVRASPQAVDVEQTQSERVLSGIQIMDIPYPSTHSLREAMTLIPGQVLDATGGLHFDGGRENQTNYLLDGFNIGDPLTGALAATVSVEAVSSLDYLSGRYSPEYGQGSAGTLQIKTQTGDDQFRYSATNFFPGVNTEEGLHLGDWTPRFNFSGPLVKGRAWFSDNLDADYNINVIPGLPKDENSTSTLQASNMLHTQVNLTPANILYSDFLFNYQRASEFGLGALTPPSTTLDERGRTWFLALKDQIYLAHGTLLELGFAEMLTLARLVPFGTGIYIITPEGNSGYNFIDSTEHSRRGQFLTNLFLPSWHFAGTHNLKMGADVDRVDYAQGIARTGYDLYGVHSDLLRSVTFEGNGFLSRPTLTASSYVTDHWQARRNLFFELGVREDWDEILRRWSFSPRAAVSYAPFGSANTRISGGYAALYDPTILQLFTRPFDQYTLTDTYTANGRLLLPNALSYYTLPADRLKAPLYQNLSAGLDHQFPWHIRAGLSLHRKRGGDGLAYVNTLPAPIVASPEVAAEYHASYVEQQFTLTNARHDQYEAAQAIVHQSLRGRYEWMASYTRSRTHSNEVLDPSLEQTILLGPNNSGPLPWDAPNRFLSWGYLPTWWKNWAVAYLLEEHTGFPFSIQHDNGQLIGAPDTYRYPDYFNLNLDLEWRFHLRKYRFAIRGGVDNLTNHRNPTEVNNILESPNFLTFYASEGRHYEARLRWLGKE
jgi:hypothetical protein